MSVKAPIANFDVNDNGFREAMEKHEHSIDIFIPSRADIPPNQKVAFEVDFDLDMRGTNAFGLLEPVNSVASKQPYIVTSTTVHPVYHGRLLVVIQNLSLDVLELAAGDKIAQLIFLQAATYQTQ